MKDAGRVEAKVDQESTASALDVAKGPARFTCSKVQKMETQCGQTVDISVTVSRADAAVQWLKDGQRISDPRMTEEESGCQRTLHIDQVRHPGDEGRVPKAGVTGLAARETWLGFGRQAYPLL